VTAGAGERVEEVLGVGNPNAEGLPLAYLDIEVVVGRPGGLWAVRLGFALTALTAGRSVMHRLGHGQALGAPITRCSLLLAWLARWRAGLLPARLRDRPLRLLAALSLRGRLIARRLRRAFLVLVLVFWRLVSDPGRLAARGASAVARGLMETFPGLLEIGHQLRRKPDQRLMAQRAQVGLVKLAQAVVLEQHPNLGPELVQAEHDPFPLPCHRFELLSSMTRGV
jgi:hypothetical protein